MKNCIRIICIMIVSTMLSKYPAQPLFAEEGGSPIHSTEAVPQEETNHTSNAKNLYQKIMLTESDIQIASGQRDYYKQERINVRADIEKTKEELKHLPYCLQKQYNKLSKINGKQEIKISYSELLENYEKKEKSLNEKFVYLEEYSKEIDKKIDDLNAKIRVFEAAKEFKNTPVLAAEDKKSSISDSEAKELLEKKILAKKNHEARNLLKDYRLKSISLCNFSCGNCYTCKLLYPKYQPESPYSGEKNKVVASKGIE